MTTAAVLLSLALLAAPPAKVERRTSVTSSDGALTATNADTGLGGTMPDLVTTLSWKSAKGGARKLELRDDERLGWVESIGVIATKSGPVYVVIAEDKLATTTYALVLRAYRIAPTGALEEVPELFPAIEEGSERGSTLSFEYSRRRGVDVFPRPIEARIDEASRTISLHLYPANRKAGDATPSQTVELTLDGSRFTIPALDDATKSQLLPE